MREIIDRVTAQVLHEASDALTFRTESRGFHSGQSDLTLRAYLNGEEVGHIDYSVYRGEPAVQMISVPKHRRRGYATAMVHQLQSEFPDVEIAMGSTTDQGSKLLASIPQEVIHNPEYQQRTHRLAQVKAALAQLQHDYEHDFPTDPQERTRLTDHWNDLNQQEWELEQELHSMQASKRLFRHRMAEAKEDAIAQKKRAAEMGYTIKAYHGSAQPPVQRFEPHSLYKYTERDYFGASFTPDPRTASHYSMARHGGHPHIMPVLIKGPLYMISQEEERRIGNAKDAKALRQRLEAEGYTGICFEYDDEIKVWTPSALRLAHARFDPEQHASDDLLA